VTWSGMARSPAACQPARSSTNDHAVRPGRDLPGDLGQVPAGRGGVDVGQDEPGADGPLRADRAEEVGPGVAAVALRRVPPRTQTRVSVPCWPTRASSWNQTSTGLPRAGSGSAPLTSAAKLP
jgi:hypothetical protein